MKSLKTAYILLICFGIFGLHRFYMKKYLSGLLYLVTFGFLGIGYIIDIVTLKNQIEAVNSKSLKQKEYSGILKDFENIIQEKFNDESIVAVLRPFLKLLKKLSSDINKKTEYLDILNDASTKEPNPTYMYKFIEIVTKIQDKDDVRLVHKYIDGISNKAYKRYSINFRIEAMKEEAVKKKNSPTKVSDSTSQKNTYLERKRKNIYSTYGGIKVLGGLLPKNLTMNGIICYYDGKRAPRMTGTTGGTARYETDGNLQVFYKSEKDIKNKLFLGNSVDFYKK